MNTKDSVHALILAAGKGTRMHSNKAKVLQEILAKPMLSYVLTSCKEVCQQVWTVIGHDAERVRQSFPAENSSFIEQKEQLGTGHALQVAWESLQDKSISYLVVVNGDTPLITPKVVKDLIEECLTHRLDLGFLSIKLADPGSFGRVLRSPTGELKGIIEAKDCTEESTTKEVEVNAGVYCFYMPHIAALLPLLRCENNNKEFYITDLVALALSHKLQIRSILCNDTAAVLGVNTPYELIESEELLRKKIVEEYRKKGVFIHNPSHVLLSPDASIEPGARISGPCEIYGESSLAKGAVVHSHCVIRDAIIESGAIVQSFSHIEKAQLCQNCTVGPFARIRPGSVLDADSHVGNFVELKNTHLGVNAKAGHLSYLGDAEIGTNSNIGAGTITCNYDGHKKHKTNIGSHVFIGSNSSLIAPVSLGDYAKTGAGSVIYEDVPEKSLGISRSPQINKMRKKL